MNAPYSPAPPPPPRGRGIEFMGYSIGIGVLVMVGLPMLVVLGCLGMCLLGAVTGAGDPAPEFSPTPWP